MKKTVTLTSAIRAKNDLEMYIRFDEIKRLKQLFVPTFDLKELNAKIDRYEDQLIKVKEAIAIANAVNKDESGNTFYYSIYLLSKYNRLKSDLLTLQKRLDTNEWLTNNEDYKKNILAEIEALDANIKNETDKKVQADFKATKAKLKRSLSKTSLTSKAHVDKLCSSITEDIKNVETIIEQIKTTLSKNNDSTSVEIDVVSEFEVIVK
jgi:hypothetical protein